MFLLFIRLAIKKREMEYKATVEPNVTCIARQQYQKIFGEGAPIPGYIEAQCTESESRSRRSVENVGTLILTFTFSEEIPFDCDIDCLNRISWILRFQFFEVQWRVRSGLTLTMTVLEASEQLNITLHTELQPQTDDPQITCTTGRILSQDKEICSKTF